MDSPPPPTPDKPPIIDDLIKKIRSHKPLDAYAVLELSVTRENWSVLWEEISDEREFKFVLCGLSTACNVDYYLRLDYRSDIEKLCPTDFRVDKHSGETATLVAFGRSFAGKSRFSIVLESGFSQTSENLERKARMHLTQPDMAAVIFLKFSTTAFRNPASSRPSVPPASLDDFKAFAGSPLGPITYGDHTWSHAIRAIELDMYLKEVGELRNRLDPLKVQKATTVRMDCQESHRAAMNDDVSLPRSSEGFWIEVSLPPPLLP
ncbi:hypothetical protein DFH09DRAFT_1501282 [Mycena vulgaris]|nr:hypothetical protein DFH09DRAFT_1501282 [Mycena vulgaris]